MNIQAILRWVFLIACVAVMWSIASQPGITGKLLVAGIIVVAAYFYWLQQKKLEAINPVTLYYRKLLDDCHKNKISTLGRLILTGNTDHPGLLKGTITGGPMYRPAREFNYKKVQQPAKTLNDKGKEVIQTDKQGNIIMEEVDVLRDKLDPRAEAYVFSYRPEGSPLSRLPLIGGFFVQPESLFCAYKHQLESTSFIGDVRVKGLSVRSVAFMEFINDWQLNYDAEMLQLEKEVERITLIDYMGLPPKLIRNAVDANSLHLRTTDLKDDMVQAR